MSLVFVHLYPFRTNAWARSQSQDGPCSHMTSWWRHDSETFPRYWPFVRGIHWSAVDSLHNEQNNVELFYVRIYKWLTRQWGSYPDSKFMGPTWGPPGSCRSRWPPCWPHEPCYQDIHCNTYVTSDPIVWDQGREMRDTTGMIGFRFLVNKLKIRITTFLWVVDINGSPLP